MPIKQAAKKALRQNIGRQARNSIYENRIKSLIKEARTLVAQKKIKEAKNLLPQVYKVLDKAAKAGVIKKNAAARKKSRITKSIAKASQVSD